MSEGGPSGSQQPDAMEVDETGKSVMASSGTAGSVSASLHPLVIMNISEHWTRIRAQEGKSQQGQYGSLTYYAVTNAFHKATNLTFFAILTVIICILFPFLCTS